jgi:hypothetical protein
VEFISEDDVKTFDVWLKYQAAERATPEELVRLRALFETERAISLATPKLGQMKLRASPGEHRYAVALREGSDLWLTLWVRRSPRGEFFVLQPRGNSDWNPHTSYHLDGTLHTKSFDHKSLPPQKRQPLTGKFQGTEHLGMYKGHGPKGVGAVCDPTTFSGIVEVASGVLGLCNGGVLVDLVEPGREPVPWDLGDVVQQIVFDDIVPWVVIRTVRD